MNLFHAQNRIMTPLSNLPSGVQAFYNFNTASALYGGVNLTLASNATLQTTGGVTFVQRNDSTGATANISATVSNTTSPRAPFALGGTAFTLAMRIRFASFDNYSSLLFKHVNSGSYDYLIYNWGGRINVGGYNNNTEAFGANSIPTNTWCNVVWRHPNTLANNRVTLRYTGYNTTNTVSISALPTNSYTALNLGTYFDSRGSNCDFDWFGVWHRELSDAELDTLWNSGNTNTWT